ncbi:MAG: sugar phosphate isomerase/epimerase, partial [Ruminococcaceae bacterium]|nr:sugar phosphate isomerase/epimerase [Oscillospiraceae bacterium]
FDNINSMWFAGDEYLDIYNRMNTAIDSAAVSGVPVVVLHLSSKWDAPPITDMGLARFDAIVDHAENVGVKVAFENLRVLGNVAYFTDRYEHRDSVGFCYDVGHEYAYTKYIDWMDIFREKTLMTHIHDNFGRGPKKEGDGDLHLLPFDGTVNYEKMMRKLDEYGYAGDLTLEVFNSMSPEYLKMSNEEFLATAYERLLKISQM